MGQDALLGQRVGVWGAVLGHVKDAAAVQADKRRDKTEQALIRESLQVAWRLLGKWGRCSSPVSVLRAAIKLRNLLLNSVQR